jgi:DNA topoisomerase-1
MAIKAKKTDTSSRKGKLLLTSSAGAKKSGTMTAKKASQKKSSVFSKKKTLTIKSAGKKLFRKTVSAKSKKNASASEVKKKSQTQVKAKLVKNSATKRTASSVVAKGNFVPKTGGKTLVVVESPTKARTLTKILGPKYVVKASIGHIVDLPKSRLGIDIENHFKPEYILVKGKAPVKKELVTASEKAGRILLAADPDREGEAIAWHVAELLGVNPNDNCRIRFHEITSEAVKKAVKNPGPIDMNRVDAQQARRVLDRLVGYKLSPLLWQKIKRGLSAGRVQSVALAIICQREKEIETFKPQDYWNVYVEASAEDGRKYRLHVEKENGRSLIKEGKTLLINSLSAVKKIEETLKTEQLVVDSFTSRKNARRQPVPFKTSTLQQMSASRLGFAPRRTMSIAQSLFEGVTIQGHGTVGLITYMRTDSLRMAPEAIAQARGVIQKKWGKKYLPAKAVLYQAGANAQDAHEAIRPTDFTLSPEAVKSSLTPEQFKLYDMIWRRSIASQMAPAIVNVSTLECSSGCYGLRAQGSTVEFNGWGAEWGLDIKDTLLPAAEKGEKLNADKITSEKEQTLPPSRYTESSLIKTLEDDGIGRPSTYASIVETLYDRLYVTREDGRKLKPTELGISVNKFLLEHFDGNSASPIVDIGFTSSMENSLDQVESGKVNWVQLISKFWTPFTSAIAEAEKAPSLPAPQPEQTGEMCPLCGRPLVKKHGRFGEFIGCSGFPECHYIKPVQKKIGVPCPKCGAEHGGEVVQRKSKKGRVFYGCSRYPQCDYVSWNKPAAQKCPVCGGLMEYEGKSRTPVCTKCGHRGTE